MSNSIDKALGVVESLPLKIPPQEIVNKVPDELVGDEVDADYKYQRENFYRLVEQGSTAIEGILELAREGEHPRAYEVAGNLIKQVSEVTEKLGDLQEKMRKLKEVPDHGPKSVTNALFIGSTKELQKLIKWIQRRRKVPYWTIYRHGTIIICFDCCFCFLIHWFNMWI